MTKRWNYYGDVSIRNGGMYWQDSGDSDYAYAVKVTPCSDAGGPDNLFWIEKGTIWLGNPDRLASALDSCGWLEPDHVPTLRDKIIAMDGYAGIEPDSYCGQMVVRIGKESEPQDSWQWGGTSEPDYVLRGNASLRKFVRREFLH